MKNIEHEIAKFLQLLNQPPLTPEQREVAIAEAKRQNDAIVADTKIKAQRMAEQCIGKHTAIKVSKNETYRGIITDCKWKVEVNARSVRGLFLVKINELPAVWVAKVPR